MIFSEWSNDLLPQQGWLGDEAAIGAFKTALPWSVSRDFVAGTAKHLASGLGGGISKPGSGASNQHSVITHDKQLDILMPAIGYGLSFPLSEVDILRDCVTIYCDWLTAFLPSPKPGIPLPVVKDPNHYAVIIISHFYYVFVPRGGEGADVNKQAVLCHRVLRTLQSVAQESVSMSEETWHVLLLFLLHINSALLSPPSVKDDALLPTARFTEAFLTHDDAGEQLCDRVLSVLFETWLLACDKCFPPPPLWTALRLGCIEWRHRAGLVHQWGRICSALTSKLLHFMYGPKYKHNLPAADEVHIIPKTMTRDCIAQIWFRFLHIIGNPVELSKETVISKTPAFLKFAISSREVIEPCQHPCLRALPDIFLAAMKVIASLVDAFIGSEDNVEPVAGRAKVNSVLHLYGAWLFEAALINTQLTASQQNQYKSESSSSVSGVIHSAGNPSAKPPLTSSTSMKPQGVSAMPGPKRPTSVYGLVGDTVTRKGSAGEADSLGSTAGGGAEDSDCGSAQDFEAGRAEALGALCRIFCSAKTGEEILPVYLSRFYLAVREGLTAPLPPPAPLVSRPITPTQDVGRKTTLGPKHTSRHPSTSSHTPNPSPPCSITAASILLHGADLFRVDLDGVCTLVPALLPVLTAILTSDRSVETVRSNNQSKSSHSLRLAATNILLSILALPLHFQDLVIKEVGVAGERHRLSLLRPQLLNLLSTALQTETQPMTIHMLLGGLMFCVQDASVCENMDSVSQHNYAASDSRDSTTPLGGDSLSSMYGGDLSSLTEESMEPTPPPPSTQATAPPSTPLGLLSTSPHDCGSTLVVRAIYLVCHHLILSWRTDVNVSLAGLELLGALARLHTPHQDWLECKRAVKWLCDYIVYQCSRPPPAHSKDLHSTIVAAFQTCSVWLLCHPSLLHDQETLLILLEVIELGISGSKSQNKGTLILKHEKPLKPVSLRVRDAAEALLSCVLSQVGRLSFTGGTELISSELEETTLLRHCNTWTGEEPITKEMATKHFRYYVSQNSILLALLEQPLCNNEEPQPSVTAIVRGPFGRSVWSIQLRHLPRHRAATSHYSSNPGRPLPITDGPKRQAVRQKFFPESVDRIPRCNADKSIPSLDSVLHASQTSSHNHDKLLQILDHQMTFEEELVTEAEKKSSAPSEGDTECIAPPVCQEFQTARLLLSHLGLLNIENLQCGADGEMPDLVSLDSSHSSFIKELECLDCTNNRSTDTVHFFYVAAGQSSTAEILDNVTSASKVSPLFLELIAGVGWSVSLSTHSGWGGRVKSLQSPLSSCPYNGGGEYNGLQKAVYWCDASSEVSFIVPSPSEVKPSLLSVDTHSLHSDTERSNEEASEGSSSFSSHSSGRRFGRQSSSMAGNDHKVMVVWLESYSDHKTFPASQLLGECVTGLESVGWRDRDPHQLSIIFLHPLENGLFRVRIEATGNKLSVAGPLVSGQVVSRRVLGVLVRQTALNMARRRRLDSDSYQPSHVLRKLRVQDMVQRYRYDMTEPEFYSHLFTSPLC